MMKAFFPDLKTALSKLEAERTAAERGSAKEEKSAKHAAMDKRIMFLCFWVFGS